jgi:hypothetical protein
MTEETVSGILPRRNHSGNDQSWEPFAYRATENPQEVVYDYSSLCMDNARRLGIDAMIVIGGDGRPHIARDFSHKGVNIVGATRAAGATFGDGK